MDANDRLLNDLFGEDGTAGEAASRRDPLLEETLRHVTRKRIRRRMLRGAAACGVLTFTGLFVWRAVGTREPGGCRMVTTERAQGLSEVSSHTWVPLVNSGEGAQSLQVVTTEGGRPAYRIISGDELLALLDGKGASLVQIGPGEQRLVLPME